MGEYEGVEEMGRRVGDRGWSGEVAQKYSDDSDESEKPKMKKRVKSDQCKKN